MFDGFLELLKLRVIDLIVLVNVNRFWLVEWV